MTSRWDSTGNWNSILKWVSNRYRKGKNGDSNPQWPLRLRCSALQVELSDQLGDGLEVGWLFYFFYRLSYWTAVPAQLLVVLFMTILRGEDCIAVHIWKEANSNRTPEFYDWEQYEKDSLFARPRFPNWWFLKFSVEKLKMSVYPNVDVI